MCELEAVIEKEVEAASNKSSTTIEEVFNHYIELYFQYVIIAQRVEDCYDIIIHPQKRDNIKEIMELIICRIIHLRHHIVKWNPSCVDNSKKGKPVEAFPWEYIDMHKYMLKLKIRPNILNTPIPSFFKEEESQKRQEISALVEGYMQLKLSTDTLPLEADATIDKEEKSNNEVELGPNGKTHDVYDALFRDSNVRRAKCATTIQKYIRSYLVRCEIRRDTLKEEIFIGLRTTHGSANDTLEQYVDSMRVRRKQGQAEVGEEYREVLVVLKDLVKTENQFDMKQSLMKERVEWVTEQISETNNIPETLDGFYKRRNTSTPDEETMSCVVNEKDSLKIDSKENPIIRNPDHLLNSINKCVLQYKDIWNVNEDKTLLTPKYDNHVAKNLVVRDKVYDEAREIVDNLLLTNLRRIKALQSTKGTKTNDKKGGDKKKKGKSSTGKGKKGKGKGKSLPGDKIPALKSMDTAHMLSILIENKLINNVEDLHPQDLIGSELPIPLDTCKSELQVSRIFINFNV